MRLEDLRICLVVSKQGNLHRAAETLGVTASALSKALARLESTAGMQLFERTSRGVVLTGVGETVVAHARKIVQTVDDMQNALHDQRLARGGAVRLGVVPNLVPSLLSPLLATFLESRPMASFTIETHLSTRLVAQLQDGEVDLILAARMADLGEGIAHLPLPPMCLKIVARTGHPRRAQLNTLADLRAERWLLPASSLYLRQWLDQRFTSAGLPAPQVAVESTASPTAFTELLRRSDLLSLFPSQILNQSEGEGLAALTGTAMSWPHELAIFWRADGYLSPICRDFRDAVVQWNQGSEA